MDDLWRASGSRERLPGLWMMSGYRQTATGSHQDHRGAKFSLHLEAGAYSRCEAALLTTLLRVPLVLDHLIFSIPSFPEGASLQTEKAGPEHRWPVAATSPACRDEHFSGSATSPTATAATS